MATTPSKGRGRKKTGSRSRLGKPSKEHAAKRVAGAARLGNAKDSGARINGVRSRK